MTMGKASLFFGNAHRNLFLCSCIKELVVTVKPATGEDVEKQLLSIVVVFKVPADVSLSCLISLGFKICLVPL